jgi:hypothetical protein
LTIAGYIIKNKRENCQKRHFFLATFSSGFGQHWKLYKRKECSGANPTTFEFATTTPALYQAEAFCIGEK